LGYCLVETALVGVCFVEIKPQCDVGAIGKNGRSVRPSMSTTINSIQALGLAYSFKNYIGLP